MIKNFTITALLAFALNAGLVAQTIEGTSHNTIGYISDRGTVKDKSHITIGYVKNGVIKNKSHITIGYAKNVRMEWVAAKFFFFDFEAGESLTPNLRVE